MSEIVTIRRFGDAAIQKALDDALSKVPVGKQGAVVAYADLDGARLAAAAKLGDHWSLVGVLEHKWDGVLEAAAEVRFVW